MTQLLPASERSSSACIRGSATMTMVPSSVDISCMPVIAMIAMPSTDGDRGAVERSVDSPADMGCQPTDWCTWARLRTLGGRMRAEI